MSQRGVYGKERDNAGYDGKTVVLSELKEINIK